MGLLILLFALSSAFVRQLSECDGEIARGAFQPVCACFKFFRIITRANRNCRERGLNLFG